MWRAVYRLFLGDFLRRNVLIPTCILGQIFSLFANQESMHVDSFDFNERTRTADAAYPADAAHRTQQTTIATTSLIDSALATISQAIVNRLRMKKADVSPASMVSETLTPSPLLPPLRPNKASYRSFSGYAMRKQNPCTYATGQCIRRWQRWRVCLLMLMLYSC